ncbi:MBL fold metallo-hydrolase [Nocardioides sp. S-58]|uniref:MBL fold metallo-hydrolase n=1 Tax=Nocardioides renjunii TaxID=3095075 RepID=A0ABU5KB20_9ACTN|nr:MBL fold metallo-hydrolase [Nocardioides sp. S-58]MDZ5662175.1 MBL fold metallo-hydrolase [Nocardioides sp. S-58]
MSIVITWLGHATVVVDIDGVRLVSDPLLRRHNGPLRRRGEQPDRAAWAGARAVLLSHLHHDHAEVSSLRLLGDVPVLTAVDNARWVTGKGLRGHGLQDEWVRVDDDCDVRVRLLPAVHHSRPMPHRPNAANGHLVRGPSGVVWIAGDTELYAGMETVPHLAGAAVDAAVVPVGGWGPRLSPGHLGPHEAAVACRRVGASLAVPVHWGTLHVPGARELPRGWMGAGGPDFAAAVTREAPDCEVAVLSLGGSVVVPRRGRRADR